MEQDINQVQSAETGPHGSNKIVHLIDTVILTLYREDIGKEVIRAPAQCWQSFRNNFTSFKTDTAASAEGIV